MTDWDVVCLDCDEEAGLRQPGETCQSVIDHVGAFAGLAAFRDGYRDRQPDQTRSYAIRPHFGQGSYEGETIDVEFFAKHVDHVLTVMDRHGTTFGLCSADFNVDCFGEPGHNGKCKGEPRVWRGDPKWKQRLLRIKEILSLQALRAAMKQGDASR